MGTGLLHCLRNRKQRQATAETAGRLLCLHRTFVARQRTNWIGNPAGHPGRLLCPSQKVAREISLDQYVVGLPLSALVAATWYGPMLVRHGAHFVDEFIVQHHFARYLSNTYHHPAPVYFYLLILILLSLPWTPFAIDGLLQVRKWLWKSDDPPTRTRTFALAWIVVPILFFSLSTSKLPGYILPVLPALAWLGGERLALWLDNGLRARWTMRVTGLLCLLWRLPV